MGHKAYWNALFRKQNNQVGKRWLSGLKIIGLTEHTNADRGKKFSSSSWLFLILAYKISGRI